MSSSYSSGSSSSSKSSTPNTPPAPPPATSVVFWADNDTSEEFPDRISAWSKGTLAGVSVPGIFECEVGGAERKADVQSPPAKGGAKIVVKGWQPSSVTLKITIWTSDQWQRWQDLKPLLRVDGASKDAVSISHPVAEESNISSILIKKISGVKDGSLRGTKVISIDAVDATALKASTTGTGGSGMTNDKAVWFELYKSYVIGIRQNSGGGGGYWLTWSTWIMQQGWPQYCAPNPPGYAAYAPPGMP